MTLVIVPVFHVRVDWVWDDEIVCVTTVDFQQWDQVECCRRPLRLSHPPNRVGGRRVGMSMMPKGSGPREMGEGRESNVLGFRKVLLDCWSVDIHLIYGK